MGDATHELNLRIKRAFDPSGLLNPGVQFTPDPDNPADGTSTVVVSAMIDAAAEKTAVGTD